MPLSSLPPFWPVGEIKAGLWRRIGARKALTPLEGSVLARRIAICESVADENHLKPETDQGPRGVLSSRSARGAGEDSGYGS